MPEAFIYDHVRTPRGRGKVDGALHEVTALNLASQTLGAIKSRNNLDTALVDDVVMGVVDPVGEAVRRQALDEIIVVDPSVGEFRVVRQRRRQPQGHRRGTGGADYSGRERHADEQGSAVHALALHGESSPRGGWRASIKPHHINPVT